jgi:hypothetical protein
MLEAQIRDALSPTTTLLPWFPVGSNMASGQQTIALVLPAATAWYLIDLRADGVVVGGTTNRIGVGEVIAAAGQSLAHDFWDAGATSASLDSTTLAALGLTPTVYGSCLAGWNGVVPAVGAPWAAPADAGPYRSSFAAEFLRLAVAATGVNCALIGYAVDGTAIASWQAGQPNYAALISVLAAAGWKFGTLIWCQGHQDAKAAGADPAAYSAMLQSIIQSLADSNPSPFNRLLCSVPSIGTAANARFDAGSIEAIRRAHLNYVATDPAARYVAGLDVTLAADGVHPNQAGNVIFARHFYRAFAEALGGANIESDTGPQITAAARAPGSSQVTLTVRPTAQLTSAGGSPETQFQVFPAGQTGSAIPINSVDLTRPGQIVLNLSSAILSDNEALDVWYRLPWDTSAAISAGIYDSVTNNDGLTTGRQLALAATPFTVPPPSWHRPVLVGPGVPMLLSGGVTVFSS